MTNNIGTSDNRPQAQPATRRHLGMWLLIAALVFQGVNGLGGGIMLLADTDGGLMGWDTTTLEGTPVDTYLIPGLLLVIPLGLIPLLVAWALLRRPRYQWTAWIEKATRAEPAWTGALAVGFGVVLWIVIEYLLIDYQWLQAVFGLVGVAIIALAFLPSVRHHYAVR